MLIYANFILKNYLNFDWKCLEGNGTSTRLGHEKAMHDSRRLPNSAAEVPLRPFLWSQRSNPLTPPSLKIYLAVHSCCPLELSCKEMCFEVAS